MASEPFIDIDAAFEEGTPIDEALNEALREVVKRHKQAGLPLASWQDGKVVWIRPEDVPLDEPGQSKEGGS